MDFRLRVFLAVAGNLNFTKASKELLISQPAITKHVQELENSYKVQLFKPYFNQESIDKAHAHGILCNVFWADDPDEARRYFEMGIDTVLTNDYLTIYNAVKEDYCKRK